MRWNDPLVQLEFCAKNNPNSANICLAKWQVLFFILTVFEIILSSSSLFSFIYLQLSFVKVN